MKVVLEEEEEEEGSLFKWCTLVESGWGGVGLTEGSLH